MTEQWWRGGKLELFIDEKKLIVENNTKLKPFMLGKDHKQKYLNYSK